MISKLLFFLFLTLAALASSQNLVPDPGFEIHNDSCINNWPGLTHWFNPNTATPDLWNMVEGCGSNIPALWAEDVEAPTPLEGDCYIGLYTSTNLEANSHTRDYLYTEMANPLEPGVAYVVQFSVYRMLYYGHAIDRLGIAFTDYAPFFDTFEVIPLQPQIETAGAVIQADSSYWQTFEFNYVAQGGEQYLTIGNFRYPEEMEIVVDPGAGSVNFSYYCFDEIQVEADIKSGVPTVEIDFYALMADNDLIIDMKDVLNFNLYDLSGRIVLTGTTSVGLTRYEVSGLSRGVYVLHVQSPSGVLSKKLWKE